MALPSFLRNAKSNPVSHRGPWFKNIAPTYAGIFLSVVFYVELGVGTISQSTIGPVIAGLILAGLLAFAFFYYVPAMLGMSTGCSYFVVCTSTFGSKGGYLPGLLMGVINLGYFSIITYTAANFIVLGLGVKSKLVFAIIAIVWGYLTTLLAIGGIHYVAKAANFINWIPLAMILFVFFANLHGVAQYQPAENHPGLSIALLLQAALGYFAAAGAAGADFGREARDGRDVRMGGLVGIALAIAVIGVLALLSIAGAVATHPGLPFAYPATINTVGALSRYVFFLFAIALIVPTSFASFISANSFATMMPNVPRALPILIGVTLGLVTVVAGIAGNLIAFFSIAGACFAPATGAMAADYLLSGKRWSGPRTGVNWAGYIAWAVGTFVGLFGIFSFIPQGLKAVDQPAVVYAFIVAFVLYWILAKAGVRSKLIGAEEKFAPISAPGH